MEGLHCYRYIDTDLCQYDTERRVLMVARRLDARQAACPQGQDRALAAESFVPLILEASWMRFSEVSRGLVGPGTSVYARALHLASRHLCS